MLKALAFLAAFLAALPAVADCRIFNETQYTFVVDSGNTYGQSLGPHQESQFARGTMTASGEDDAGKHATFSGTCGDGDRFVVREVRGSRGEWIPVLVRR